MKMFLRNHIALRYIFKILKTCRNGAEDKQQYKNLASLIKLLIWSG